MPLTYIGIALAAILAIVFISLNPNALVIGGGIVLIAVLILMNR